jgi:phosphoglycolate phosphatase-like HAD superfamily hydrolase
MDFFVALRQVLWSTVRCYAAKLSPDNTLGVTNMHAAIFDIDGTVLQSDVSDDALYLKSVHDTLGEVKLRQSWGMYTQFTAAGILTEILRDNDLEATPERVAAVRNSFIEGVRRHMSEHGPFAEIPGARAYLQGLHASSTHRIAYATGGWGGSARDKLSLAGFPVVGVPLASSDDHYERQQIMLCALGQLAGVFDSVTYYGDGHWDAVAAKALGWQFVPVGAKLEGLTRYVRRDA